MMIAVLGITGGWRILRQAKSELAGEAKYDPARAAFAAELEHYRAAKGKADFDTAWHHLERAHIVAQPKLGIHLSSHIEMLKFAIFRRDAGEVVGQLFRLALAPLGALSGRIPVGNIGRSTVSAFTSMPIPDDLKHVLARIMRKCPVCAYNKGVAAKGGKQFNGPADECSHGETAPKDMLKDLPDYQGGKGRHKCCYTAYQAGLSS